MDKLNCWEYKKCGRGNSDSNMENDGICPAACDTSKTGLNGGKNAGRICWEVAGTFCKDTEHGTFANKLFTCLDCDFYVMVLKEEGKGFRQAAY